MTLYLRCAAQNSVFGGVAAARQLDAATLMQAVRAAFTGGMDVMLIVCRAIALIRALLAIAYLPRDAAATKTTSGGGDTVQSDAS